ncbi:MAG: response regulator [Deltaproteobacteria bacterium]|nr:response regulator [Deltaproteobacteria bacterium]
MAKTIMVVDDSATMRMSLKSGLELSGFKVECAGDGLLALNQIKSGVKPDLIIADINMPNMGGLEFMKALRALPGFRFTPILALTTESKQEKKDEAKKYGATGWLVKPVTGPDLVKVIKQVLPGA